MGITKESKLYRDRWLENNVGKKGFSFLHIEKGTLYKLSNGKVINIKFRGERIKEWYWAAVAPNYLEKVDWFVFLLDGDDTFYVIPRTDLKQMLSSKPMNKKTINFNISPSSEKLLCGKEHDIRRYRGHAEAIFK